MKEQRPDLAAILISGLTMDDYEEAMLVRKPFGEIELRSALNSVWRNGNCSNAHTILVIDDDELVGKSAGAMLTANGKEVILAKDGQKSSNCCGRTSTRLMLC